MSFTKLAYDDDTYITSLNESIGPGMYNLQRPRVCEQECTFYPPGVILDRFNDGMCEKELIDVDSELLGINRRGSRCPARKYMPSEQPFCKAKQSTKECTFLAAEPTLISNPKATNKETTMNRWQWLCKNPQEKALIPFDWNIDNRLLVKINHRPCIKQPMDQSALLPPKCNEYVRYDWSSKYANMKSLHIPSTQLAYCENIPKL